ncbi:MAG: cyclic nucleotide-binding domain-containing protein, partial [Myxococcales bacterium]|nr:cyclic nucleotide-binding domain-containing protein [Myxococcales bacterium]
MAITPRTAEELLKDVSVLKELPAGELKLLADCSEVRKAARGAPVFSEGQRGEGLFIVRTGEVKLTKSGRDGREQILYLARPGKAIAEGLRFDRGSYPASAIAMRAASVILIPNKAISDIGDRCPNVLRA